MHVHDYITIYKYTTAATLTTDGRRTTTMTNGKNKLTQKILVFPCHAQAEAAAAATAAAAAAQKVPAINSLCT